MSAAAGPFLVSLNPTSPRRPKRPAAMKGAAAEPISTSSQLDAGQAAGIAWSCVVVDSVGIPPTAARPIRASSWMLPAAGPIPMPFPMNAYRRPSRERS